MSFAHVKAAQSSLLNSYLIDVEVDLSHGLHSFSVVGLPDKGVEESRDRVAAAIKNSGFTSPKATNQKVVVSLAPAEIKKEGPLFDLAIAVCYLKAAEEIECDTDNTLFLGELSLDGALRGVRGVLPLVRHAKESGIKSAIVPLENASEAALIDGIDVYPARTLTEVLEHVENKKVLEKQPTTELSRGNYSIQNDLADIRGNEAAKRGLEIAAAGGHNIALYGPPGTGKTMLAKAFRHLLPELSFDDALDVTSIHSVAGTLSDSFITEPPFRAPHHTSSYVSVVGGGQIPKPGEITLAHKGVLFLDEFPEFDRRVIETLREPIEERVINVTRAKGSAHFPADFILIAAMNPCPCGFKDTEGKECVCTPQSIIRYQKKLSGPIVDRIDMWIEVAKVDHEKLMDGERGEETAVVKKRIDEARASQIKRGAHNSQISPKDIQALVPLAPEVKNLLDTSAERLGLSARMYHRIVRLARTIADLEKKEGVEENHILEALQYRPKMFS